MTEINKYLAEEVGIDYADGLISRRDALRRLVLLGLSSSAAAGLLAACADRTGTPTVTPTAARQPRSPAESPTARTEAVESISFSGTGDRTLKAAWAPTKSPMGAVLVIHENRGLNDHIRAVIGRLAGDDFSALAVDLLSEEGGTESFSDPAQAMAALGQVAPQRFVEDMKSALTELALRTPNAKLAATGFCFGGGMVWRLLTSGEDRLSAAAPFYGPFPENGDLSGTKAAVLAIYGALDARVNATRDAARQALEQARLPHDIVTFPGADHAFFNETGPRYNRDAAEAAYARMLEWFGRYLGP